MYGSHHTSPKVRLASVGPVVFAQLVQLAVASKSPPAGAGGSSTFHVPLPTTSAGKLVLPPMAGETVTASLKDPVAGGGHTTPYSAARAGARCRTAFDENTDEKLTPGAGGGGGGGNFGRTAGLPAPPPPPATFEFKLEGK